MTNIFYVYEHWRTDTNQCFYVGKGKYGRAYYLGDRSKKHKELIKEVLENGFDIEIKIIESNLSEDFAFSLEKERILFWKNSGVNLTNRECGYDTSIRPDSVRNTEKWKKRRNESLKKFGGRKKGFRHLEETKIKMSISAKNRKKTV